VDNPFLPRNVNNTLIYNDDNAYYNHVSVYKHNVDFIDTDARMLQYIPVGNARMNERMDKLNVAHNIITGPNQLTTMYVVNDINHSSSYKHQTNRHKESTSAHKIDQQDIVALIQETITIILSIIY
jgi:hypothetical protein